MNKKGKLLVLAFILLVLLLIWVITYFKNNKEEVEEVEEVIPEQSSIVARFDCANGSFIDAEFNNNQEQKSVDLTLSDARKFTLPEVISASGARYANADESFVFWNKDDTAFIEEGGQTTYTDCVMKKVEDTNLIGGDADEHGCLASAGYSWCKIKSKCLRAWEEACEVSNLVSPVKKLVIKNETICKENNGVWYSDDKICEINSFLKTECVEKGGVHNDCASACRHDPDAEICTLQCVITCSFK
ncbi:MAG: MliC family protein [Patescibacteria group bacterium]